MDSWETLRGQPVLVTGHTGFKGSWLALWLNQLGARVSGFSLDPPTTPSNYAASGLSSVLVRDARGDIRDRRAVATAVAEVQPAVIFHLAAQALVRQSYLEPIETFDANVMGCLHVLEAVRLAGRPCVVVMVTSDKCYDNREQVWGHRECDPMGGNDPYSASKGAAEIAIAGYRRSFFHPADLAQHGVKVATARAGNVFGGGDWAADRIVPDAIRALTTCQPVPVRNPASVRPWQHVLEPLSGYIELAVRMLNSDADWLCSGWNFGPDAAATVPVKRLVELILQAWGEGTWEDRSCGSAPHEANILRLAIEKAQTMLGWRPRWTVEQAVAKSVAWYREFAATGQDMRARCLADIDEYSSFEGGPK